MPTVGCMRPLLHVQSHRSGHWHICRWCWTSPLLGCPEILFWFWFCLSLCWRSCSFDLVNIMVSIRQSALLTAVAAVALALLGFCSCGLLGLWLCCRGRATWRSRGGATMYYCSGSIWHGSMICSLPCRLLVAPAPLACDPAEESVTSGQLFDSHPFLHCCSSLKGPSYQRCVGLRAQTCSVFDEPAISAAAP